MGKTHTVRFEPVGIEMEADEDETILAAAFRQGIMLMHGCKEGQCSACKSFLLDGDVDLDKYSTFALPDFEEAEGWTLLCRAHAYSDLEVELINYDEEVLHGGTPPRTVAASVTAVEALTHDITRLCLTVEDDEPFEFKPGQYVDIRIPGGDDDEHRSFSMANLAAEAGELEFMIKRYEGGRFSGLLGEDGIKAGDTLAGHRPVRRLHAARELTAPVAVHRRRGGDGADPLPAAVDGRGRRRTSRPPTTTAHAPRPISSISTNSRSWAGPTPRVHLRPGSVRGGRRRRLGRRERAHHRRRRAPRRRSRRGRRLPVRATADGRCGHRDARSRRRAGIAHLLRQVHHDGTSVREERSWPRTPR